MYVYALSDPRTGEIRYIGIARDIYKRFAQHLTEKSTGNLRKRAWMDDMKHADVVPILTVLEPQIDESIIRRRERYWIEYYLALGASLTNIAHGPCTGQVVETDYIGAHEAAEILSIKCGCPVRTDYISKMAKLKKHAIRTQRAGDRLLYHKEDISNCTIGQRALRKAQH